MRLTNEMRRAWLKAVFEERKGVLDDAVKVMLKLPGWLYDATYDKATQRRMNRLPEGWMLEVDHVTTHCLELPDVKLEKAIDMLCRIWSCLDAGAFNGLALGASYCNVRARINAGERKSRRIAYKHRDGWYAFRPEIVHDEVLEKHRDEIIAAAGAIVAFDNALEKLGDAAQAATTTKRLKDAVPELAHVVDALEGKDVGNGKGTALTVRVPCETIEALGLSCNR